MGGVAGRQNHLHDEQTTRLIHRLADMAKDRQTPGFVPVMDDVG